MRVLRGDPASWPPPGEGHAVTIGVYDGVHLGHQRVLGHLVAEAGRRRLVPAVLTFDVHPLEVVAPEQAPALLTTVEQRLEIFGALRIGLVGVLPFRQMVRSLTPEEFVERILVRGLAAGLVVVGEDFRFGRDRAGDVGELRRLGAEHGFDVEAVDLLATREAPVSSTVIRREVAEGRVEEAARALGRWFELRGTVVEGAGRGREIGIPTANLDLPDGLVLPARGVYAGYGRLRARQVPAALNVGIRPMFPSEREVVEAHLIGFEGDLYGRELTVGFCRRLREERRFDTVEELVAQIRRDIEETLEVVSPLPVRLP